MKDQINSLLAQLDSKSIVFKDVIEFIEQHYQYTPAAFNNGNLRNEATQNQGSAKVFAFAKLNGLDEQTTLQLFAEHYQSVLENPEGADHQNIRQFMLNGWEGVSFDASALELRS